MGRVNPPPAAAPNGRKSGKSRAATPETEPLDASIEVANTLELEHAALSKLMSKDRTAGEMIDKGDLWECLFGNVQDAEEEQDSGGAAASGGGADGRFKDKAVMSYLAAEAAETRREV